MSRERKDFLYRFLPGRNSGTLSPLLLLHGTGGDENYMIPLGRGLSREATLLSPRGTIVEKGKTRFFRRLADGTSDLEDLKARTHELADFIKQAAATYGFEPARLFAIGLSNGADIAASLLLLRPELLRGAILFRPMVVPKPEMLPDLSNVSVLVSAGLTDPIATKEQAQQIADLLRRAGAEVCFRSWRADHDLKLAEIKEAREWLSGRIQV